MSSNNESAAESCPGIIFPTPYPQGYGDTPLLPRAAEPTRRSPEHARARPGWQCSMRPTAVAPRHPGAGPGRRADDLPVTGAGASALGTRSPRPRSGSTSRAPSPGRPLLRSRRAVRQPPPVAVRGRNRTYQPVLERRTTLVGRLPPPGRCRRRRGALGRVQLSARTRRTRRLRVLFRGRDGLRARPDGRDDGVPSAPSAVRAGGRRGTRHAVVPRADATRPGHPRRTSRWAARRGLYTRRVIGSHTWTRMFSAKFPRWRIPWVNGLPTPLPPGEKGPMRPLAPYGYGPSP